MRLITVLFLVTLCAAVAFARVLPDKQEKLEEDKITPDIKQEGDKETPEEDGSGSTMEMFDSSAEGSASGFEEQNDEGVQLPRPMQFPFSGFKGPVTITPMEPGINKEKPYRRPCYMCFPRGRLGRVEVTAPGGPFLMNNFGLVGYGMGFPGGMGPPPGMGPVGNPDMGFPEYGPYGGGPCGPGNDGPCEGPGQDYSNEPEPMDFQELPEPEPEPKPMHHKVMDHAPAKGLSAPVVAKPVAAAAPVAAAPVAVAPKAPAAPAAVTTPLKGVADETVKKPFANIAVTLASNPQSQTAQAIEPAKPAQQVNDKVQTEQQETSAQQTPTKQ